MGDPTIKFEGMKSAIKEEDRITGYVSNLFSVIETSKNEKGIQEDSYFAVTFDGQEKTIQIFTGDRGLHEMVIYNQKGIIIAVFTGDMREYRYEDLWKSIQEDDAGNLFCYECRKFKPRPGMRYDAMTFCKECWSDNRNHCKSRLKFGIAQKY